MARGFRNQYPDALRRRVVLDYIEKNSRAPSREQIFELMQEGFSSYPRLNDVGFSSLDISTSLFKEHSSVQKENKNQHAFRDDLVVINNKITEMTGLLEDGYRAFLSTADRCMKLGTAINTRISNLRLLSGKLDIFVHGFEEVFDTNEFIDLEKSTVQVNPGYVTLGRNKFVKEDISDARIDLGIRSAKGILSRDSNVSVTNLLNDNGVRWKHTVFTQNRIGRMSVTINIDFNTGEEGRYVGDIRLTGSPLETNSPQFVTVYYSLDGTTFTVAEPVERRFLSGENVISIGMKGVQKVQIVLSKKAADLDIDTSFQYVFTLDNIDILSGNYTVENKSTLYAGPYYVTDDTGNPINFSYATLAHGTCCIVPDKTSVSFFLSKDNENWIPASFTEESLSVIQFAISNPVGTYAFLDDTVVANTLTTNTNLLGRHEVEIEYGKEAVCNVYIPYEYSDKFVLQNTYVKRNVPEGSSKLYGVAAGWFLDKETMQYKTAVQVDALEGAVLNLGSTSAYIDGKLVTGMVTLPKGYHDFSTSYTNWDDIPVGIGTASKLEEADPSYPFNHKLLIEGYNYPLGFSGDRVYGGLSSNFGALLQYVTPERFAGPEFDGDLSIYTVEDYNGSLFFKVKIDPSDASWVDERVQVEYMLRTDDTNTLYAKAILTTRDSAITPNINRFQVRVV
jgi:hypothetical protein